MNLLGLIASLETEFFSGNISPIWIPVVGIVTGTIMIVCIVAIVMHNKQQMQRMDYELHLRRMDHERRMKELELELVKTRETRGVGAAG